MATPLDWYNLRRLRQLGLSSNFSDTARGRVHWMSGEGGGEETVVLVHGLGSRGAHYRRLCELLLPRVGRLILPDLLGHGHSELPPDEGAWSTAAIQESLDELLDGVLDRPVVLYGNSLGGRAALRYTAHRPDRVRALVVTSPAGGAARSLTVEEVCAPFFVDSHAQALAFADRVFARPPPMKPAVAWVIRSQLSDPGVRTLLTRTGDHDVLPPEELGALRVPTLFVWGRDERVLPREHLEYFRAHLPAHVHFEEPEGYGHSAYAEVPEDLVERILGFARLAPQAG